MELPDDFGFTLLDEKAPADIFGKFVSVMVDLKHENVPFNREHALAC